MRCSHCGGETTGATGRCSACGATLPGLVATSVLTPVPADWGITRLPDVNATLPPGSGKNPAKGAAGATGAIASGAVFGARYHIIRPLGEGGMGRVYHAWDAELGVAVALKVIRSEIADDPAAAAEIERRFKRELLLARQVSHKNVVRIHDLGDVAGTKYITMTYVEGADLSTILAREGKLPVPRVVHFARQIAAGLQAAHEVGIVHRDLKPGNVMVGADDHAQILDFGIARSSASDSGVGTMAGTIVGTIEYMAPEQATGKPADQRADVYAFGLILYDLLLGRRPAPLGESAVASLMARIKQAPPSPRSIDASIPEALDAIVMTCLQPDPAARYQTSAELVAALDRIDDAGLPLPEKLTARVPKLWLASAALGFGLMVGTATWWATRLPAAPVEREPVSVLIADFENRAGDPMFNGLLEQALGVGMEGASFIAAYPRQDAERLLEQITPGEELNRENARLLSQREGITVVLAGSIALSGSGYEITVDAVDPVPNTTLASVQRRAGSKPEVLTAIAEVASDLRATLGDTTPESAKLAAKETFTAASLEAAAAYTQAQRLLNASKYEESTAEYRRATELDPNFGRAYASWAVAAYTLGRHEEAEQLYKKAFSLVERMSEREKYRTYGTYYLTVARDYEKAIENYQTLVNLYPADDVGHGNLAVAYFYTLDFAKAAEEGQRAMKLRPTSLKLRNNFALYAMYAGDFTSAETDARKVIEADASYYRAYTPIAISALAAGRLTDANAAYERMAETGPQGASLSAIGLADLALYQGRAADALAILLKASAAGALAPAAAARQQILLAEAHAALGQHQDALQAARRAIELRPQASVLLPAARIFLQAGREAEAKAVAARLGSELQRESRAYARLIDAEIALRAGRTIAAIDALREAQKVADYWMTRMSLGIAYLEAGRYPDALAEFESCLKRRGEATALFLDDVPTFRYLAPLPYWLGRAQEALGVPAAAESYKAFTAARAAAVTDPLMVDAQRRLRALTP